MAAIDHAKRHDLCDHVGEKSLSNGQTVPKLEQNEARYAVETTTYTGVRARRGNKSVCVEESVERGAPPLLPFPFLERRWHSNGASTWGRGL